MPIPPRRLRRLRRLRSLEGTPGWILDLLRRSALTANAIATELGLTHKALRVHLAALQREELVREGEGQAHLLPGAPVALLLVAAAKRGGSPRTRRETTSCAKRPSHRGRGQRTERRLRSRSSA
jgi:DNA-binding transcriptional ArsR family regulator